MAKNILPSSDNDLNVWLQHFVTGLAMNAGTVGLVADDLTPITNASDAFMASLSACQAQKALTDAAVGLKNTDRKAALAVLRPLIQRIVKHPGMTDQLRGLLGLGRDDMAESPIAIELLPPPSLFLESAAGKVYVHVGPTPQNERTNGKPAGVFGYNIYRRKVGDPDFALVTLATSSPYVDTITGPGADYEYVACYRGVKATQVSASSDAETIAARGVLAA